MFLVKQDDIYSNLKTTRFFERLFGSTPEFIQKHEVKEKKVPEIETVIELKTEKPVGNFFDINANIFLHFSLLTNKKI